MALGNMRNHLCIIALYLLAVVSCTPDLGVGTPFVEGQEVTLTASIADNPSGAKQMPGKQRVSGKDAGATIDLTWNAGDEILVSVGDKSAVFTLSSGENTSAGEFTGKMPADGNEYSVSYPVDYSDNVLTHQTYVENGFGNGLMKMSTRTNGTLEGGFVLSADNAVLGLQLTGSQTLGEIVLTNTATAKTYTLHCDGVVLTAEAILFYIVVPVKDWANGMRVEVYDNDGDIILMKEKAGEIMFSATDAMVMPALQTCERGKRIGVFSVSPTKKVSFSQGNLQYIQSTKTWQFAKEQWEYIGEANMVDGTLADCIDLFDWSGVAGISFNDWGTNEICGDAPNTWRTLSHHEWKYLLHDRPHATELLLPAMVENTCALVLLPDDWVCPDGLQLMTLNQTSALWDNSTFSYKYSENIFQKNCLSKDSWQSMEIAGAVFLLAAGNIDKNGVLSKCGTTGRYWSSTPHTDTKGYYMSFGVAVVPATNITNTINTQSHFNRDNGHSVRLVHDTIVPEAVDLGLSVKWATFNVGATSPEDYGDYFAWGETETKENYNWATYKWCEGTSTNMTKYNAEDGKTILEPADDAAQVHWGGKWRMPSKEEVDELTQQCNWIWTTHNNVNGYKVTGPNGNSIFLPAAGYKGGGPTYPAGEDGLYWTNTTEKGPYSYLIVLHNDAPPTQAGRQGTRCFGFTIRPVYDDRVE